MNALLVRVRSWICALPIGAVTETMRALEVQAIAGTPRFVRGLAAVRGSLVPVIDLAALLGAPDIGTRGARLVSLRTAQRQLAVEVDEVLGIRHLDPAALERTPPLLSGALPGCVERLGSLDGETLAVLEAARLVPDDMWARFASAGEPAG